MGLRDWFMNKLMRVQAREPTWGSPKPVQALLTDAERLSLVLDGVKLIGTGNGAGALAPLAAMYYFAQRPELQTTIKVGAVFYLVGLLIFAMALLGLIYGLTTISTFAEKLASQGEEIPEPALSRGIDALIVAFSSAFGLLASLACFFVGTAIGLYSLVKF